MSAGALGELGLSIRLRTVGALLIRLAIVIGLFVVYYLLPLDHTQDPRTIFSIGAGMLIVVVIAAWQIRLILRSPRPLAEGVQALAISVPLYLLVFAAAYYVMALSAPSSFTERMSRTDSLYFTMTVFTTVGFGDIAPVAEPARVTVMVQMVCNLLVLGVLLRIVILAVKISRARQEGDDVRRPAEHHGEDADA